MLLGRGGSTFGGLGFGRVSDRGEPEAVAHAAIRDFAQRGSGNASPVEPTLVAGEPAWTYRIAIGQSGLVEWQFARRGWLFGAGALCRPSDKEPAMVALARAVLATWTWLDDVEEARPATLWSTGGTVAPPSKP